MKMFLTKVWGWDVPVGPLQFSTSGWRDNALRQLQQEPGACIVLVGTMGDQTPEEMKGRLLGVMEPSLEPVMTLDFDVRARAIDFVDGGYKWPVGLMNLRAWSLPEHPRLNEISDRTFSMDSAQGIVPLTDDEVARVLALHWHQEELLRPTAQAQARMDKKHGVEKRRTAPPPTTTRRGVMHMRRAPAYTYAMKIVGARSNAFKIGWAFDFKQRARQFNHAALPALGGLEYKPLFFHMWDTARQAFAMEQALLAHLLDRRHPDNSEIVTGLSDDELLNVWHRGIIGKL